MHSNATLVPSLIIYRSTGIRTHSNTENIKDRVAEIAAQLSSKPDEASAVASETEEVYLDQGIGPLLKEQDGSKETKTESLIKSEKQIKVEVKELNEVVVGAADAIQRYLERPETRQILEWTRGLPKI
jgi:hypothetical protein